MSTDEPRRAILDDNAPKLATLVRAMSTDVINNSRSCEDMLTLLEVAMEHDRAGATRVLIEDKMLRQSSDRQKRRGHIIGLHSIRGMLLGHMIRSPLTRAVDARSWRSIMCLIESCGPCFGACGKTHPTLLLMASHAGWTKLAQYLVKRAIEQPSPDDCSKDNLTMTGLPVSQDHDGIHEWWEVPGMDGQPVWLTPKRTAEKLSMVVSDPVREALLAGHRELLGWLVEEAELDCRLAALDLPALVIATRCAKAEPGWRPNGCEPGCREDRRLAAYQEWVGRARECVDYLIQRGFYPTEDVILTERVQAASQYTSGHWFHPKLAGHNWARTAYSPLKETYATDKYYTVVTAAVAHASAEYVAELLGWMQRVPGNRHINWPAATTAALPLPLVLAARRSDEDGLAIIRLLLQRGANPNAQDVTYGSALHAAAACGNVGAVQVLLGGGAFVNLAATAMGNVITPTCKHPPTPTQLAVYRDNPRNETAFQGRYKECITALVRAGGTLGCLCREPRYRDRARLVDPIPSPAEMALRGAPMSYYTRETIKQALRTRQADLRMNHLISSASSAARVRLASVAIGLCSDTLEDWTRAALW